MRKNLLLAIGYALAGLMAIAIVLLPASLWSFLLVFGAAGIYVAIEETLEDSLCAELVPGDHHGMAFGVLATVNGIGDFLSSIIVGALWSAFGTRVAFGYSAVLFFSGALLVARLQNSHPPGPSDVRLSA
jgi:MFS family permease